MEDLNNILNAGDVPNIYAPEELDNIYTAMKPIISDADMAPTKTNMFATYTKRVRSNLHTVITMRSICSLFQLLLTCFSSSTSFPFSCFTEYLLIILVFHCLFLLQLLFLYNTIHLILIFGIILLQKFGSKHLSLDHTTEYRWR